MLELSSIWHGAKPGLDADRHGFRGHADERLQCFRVLPVSKHEPAHPAFHVAAPIPEQFVPLKIVQQAQQVCAFGHDDESILVKLRHGVTYAAASA